MDDWMNDKEKDSEGNEHQGNPAAGFFGKLSSSASSCHSESVCRLRACERTRSGAGFLLRRLIRDSDMTRTHVHTHTHTPPPPQTALEHPEHIVSSIHITKESGTFINIYRCATLYTASLHATWFVHCGAAELRSTSYPSKLPMRQPPIERLWCGAEDDHAVA